jgi:hypothetical protein
LYNPKNQEKMGTTLTASYKSNYPKISKNGNPITVFVYRVSGTEQELADYRAAQGDNFVTDDDGTPLYFTVNPAPTDVCKMYKVQGGQNAGQYRLDLAEFRKDMAIVAAAGGNLGQAIATNKASKYLDISASLQSKLQQAVSTAGAEDMEE